MPNSYTGRPPGYSSKSDTAYLITLNCSLCQPP